ncbi:DnaA family protein [Polaromonas sp. CG_9.7]|jgi:DnaA family protein|nr:DnaA family protein [Polaromonas sp. CG_9.7]MBG6113062.1 DnaA family protein [Polaromonas sp. CG_9.2]
MAFETGMRPAKPAMKQLALDIGLASDPSFANFFIGPNEAAVRQLASWAQSLPDSPVPTYLWGGEASGKTHLLKAVSEALRDQGASSGWMDASMLEPPEFNEAWSAVIMDECHLYNAAQQRSAFNWFVNALSTDDGQPRWVVAAGNVPPADLPLREDLRTRLGWGHVFALQALSDDERRAVIKQEADARGFLLNDEVVDFMLTRFSRDLGSLMQLLDKLDSYALQTKRAITIPLIKTMLETE